MQQYSSGKNSFPKIQKNLLFLENFKPTFSNFYLYPFAKILNQLPEPISIIIPNAILANFIQNKARRGNIVLTTLTRSNEIMNKISRIPSGCSYKLKISLLYLLDLAKAKSRRQA